MLNVEKVKIVANLYKRERETSDCVYPTDEEVVAGTEVFYAMIDLANMFGLEMLSAWAVMRYQHFNGIAWARKIQDQVHYWTEPTSTQSSRTTFARNIQNQIQVKLDDVREKSDLGQKGGVSAAWVLNQFAGMNFVNKNGRDAYDFIKECMKAAEIKIP